MAPKASGTPTLTVVSDEIYQLDRKPETTPQRIRRLQNEARLLAHEQIEEMNKAIGRLANHANEIAAGGEAYPAGIRELASRLTEDLTAKHETFQALLARTPQPK